MKSKEIPQLPYFIVGANCIRQLSKEVNLLFPIFHSNILIIYSKSQVNVVENIILPQFEDFQCKVQIFPSEGEPNCKILDQFRKQISDTPNLIIGIGGGSAIDYAKALAALLLHSEESHKYLEGIGSINYTGPSLPLVAIPTTAGTGSECTMNTVLTYEDENYNSWKKSIRHSSLMPHLVFLDPNLTLGLSPQLTLHCGLDAFSQSLEAYISNKATPESNSWSLPSLKRILHNLPIVLKYPENAFARFEMLLASSSSGVALTHSGLGVVHGLAGPLGALTSFSHGHLCASFLLPTLKLFGKECSQKEIEYLSEKLEVLVPSKYFSRKETYLTSFQVLIEYWIESMIPISLIKIPDSGELIENVLKQFSIRNHPTPFSKDLATQAMTQVFSGKIGI